MSKITIIAAHDKCKVIGVDGVLPWSNKTDMKHFRNTTNGHVVIMGRTTWESLDCPLHNRVNIILSHTPNSVNILKYKDNPRHCVLVMSSLNDAISHCRKTYTDKGIFIIGGHQLYEQAFACATDMILTELDIDALGSYGTYKEVTRFPTYTTSDWLISSRPIEALDNDTGVKLTITKYHKKKATDISDDDCTINMMTSTFKINKLLSMLGDFTSTLSENKDDTKLVDRYGWEAIHDFTCMNFYQLSHLVEYNEIGYTLCWNDENGDIYQIPFITNEEEFAKDFATFVNNMVPELNSNVYVMELTYCKVLVNELNLALPKSFSLCNYFEVKEYSKIKRMAEIYCEETYKDLGLDEYYKENKQLIHMVLKFKH